MFPGPIDEHIREVDTGRAEADVDAKLGCVANDDIGDATVARDFALVTKVQPLKEARAVDDDVGDDRVGGVRGDPARPGVDDVDMGQ